MAQESNIKASQNEIVLAENEMVCSLTNRVVKATEKEVKSLQNELRPEYRYKIQALSLEDFVSRILKVCPPEYASPFVWFRHRYLDFSRVE